MNANLRITDVERITLRVPFTRPDWLWRDPPPLDLEPSAA